MDNQGRKLSRNLNHGDNPMAALSHGARTGDVNLVVNSISGVLSNIPIDQQRQILKEIADVITKNPKAMPSATKVFEIHGPYMGNVSIEEFISVVCGAVEDALYGRDNELISLSKQAGRWGGSIRLSKSNLKKHIAKTFENYSGSFVISCSSAIQVYALHESPTKEEIDRRKKVKEINKVQNELNIKRAAIKNTVLREQRLRVELAKLTRDEKRYKANLEKAEKSLKQLKDE